MNRKTIITITLLLLTSYIYSQKERYFTKSLIVGSSLTFIQEKSDKIIGYKYNEYTWNINMAVSLNKRAFLGLQYLNIHSNGTNVSPENYGIYGVFGQVNLLRKSRNRLFVESSINRGNYFTNYDTDPYKKEDLYYLGFGSGYDLSLDKFVPNLYADFSFIYYLIINPLDNKTGYSQYIIGLNYRFGS